MSWEDARKAIKMAEVALDGLDLIEKVTGLGGHTAEQALAVTRAALAALRKGFAGESSPQTVLAQIEQLHDKLSANDAVIEELAREKFGSQR